MLYVRTFFLRDLSNLILWTWLWRYKSTIKSLFLLIGNDIISSKEFQSMKLKKKSLSNVFDNFFRCYFWVYFFFSLNVNDFFQWQTFNIEKIIFQIHRRAPQASGENVSSQCGSLQQNRRRDQQRNDKHFLPATSG